LNIPLDFLEIQNSDYDLMYLALGSKYLRALGNDWSSNITKITICFQKKITSKKVVSLPADALTVKAYSAARHKIHGVAGFKGDLLRILVDYALEQESPLEEIESWTNTEHFYDIFYSLGDMIRPVKE
jgi:hypothetical protein